MSPFDKFCAVVTVPIGVLFMLLGVLGLFTGVRAHFSLPPIFGALPFFVGWAMSVTLVKFWRDSRTRHELGEPFEPVELDRLDG